MSGWQTPDSASHGIDTSMLLLLRRLLPRRVGLRELTTPGFSWKKKTLYPKSVVQPEVYVPHYQIFIAVGVILLPYYYYFFL